MVNSYDLNREFNKMIEEAYGSVKIFDTDYSTAKILFELDYDAYVQALSVWNEGNKQSILELARKALNYRDNKKRFKEICGVVSKGRVIPFVGAGLSVPCGKPSWRDTLIQLSDKAEIDRIETEKKLDNGEYEEVTEEIIHELGANGFDDHFDHTFKTLENLSGAVLLLPQLTSGCVITTNFDTILESTFQNAGCPFKDEVIGNQQSEFIRALANGDRYLLKLHGNIGRVQTRVLTKSEYCKAYGSEEIDFAQPLPKALSRVFSHYCMLFLGCSLGKDRTMQLFYDVVTKYDDLPKHYAIVERPADEKEVKKREKFLTDRMIFPIWYPNKDHQCVEALLTLLLENI